MCELSAKASTVGTQGAPEKSMRAASSGAIGQGHLRLPAPVCLVGQLSHVPECDWSLRDGPKQRRGTWLCENCDSLPATRAWNLKSHDPGPQLSHGKQEASGNPSSVGGETGDYALLLPGREDLVGMRLHQALGDQYQASSGGDRSQGPVWQRPVYLRAKPRDWGPGFEPQLYYLLAM